MKKNSIALMIFGETHSPRNALTEDKYKNLAIAFQEKGFDISSVIYNDDISDQLATQLLGHDAILVWVNPLEQGNNRNKLDTLLRKLSDSGCCFSSP